MISQSFSTMTLILTQKFWGEQCFSLPCSHEDTCSSLPSKVRCASKPEDQSTKENENISGKMAIP